MTKLQQNMTALLVALSLGTTPLWAQETSVPENSQTTQEASAVTQEETENANQPVAKVEPQEEATLPEETQEQEQVQRPPRKELDIHTPEHIHIQKYLDDYQKPFGIRWLTSVLESGAPYRMYARQQLALNNMPASLEYLPVVESEYKVTAKSKSGALGIWRFMEHSIYPF